MAKINEKLLKEVLGLRAENGLVATEEAMYADLDKSKAKWTTEETPRYRQAGRSPLYLSGKYLSSYGTDPASGEKDGKEKKAKKTTPTESTPKASSKIEEADFLKFLHSKGYKVKVSRDLITGQIEQVVPASITNLDLQFSAIGSNATGIHITQTSPQIQVAMPLDRFLDLAGIKA